LIDKCYGIHVNTKEQILRLLKRKAASGADLARRLQISRQAVNACMQELVIAGLVIKTGATRGALYGPVSARSGPQAPVSFAKSYDLTGLAEDAVFQEAARRIHLERAVAGNVRDIIQYGFTEMLNNAIEHSHASSCKIRLWLDSYACAFSVRDPGMGLFHSITSKFGLPDENAAVGELLKGKTSTIAERHSGEGIFFTSRVGDTVSLRSHRIELVFYGHNQDVAVNAKRFLRGTEVRFRISRRSRRKLESVFEEYAPADLDYRFDKTRVFVKLFCGEYVSRSEARRMLAGLDKFKIVELDFRNVKSLGQGFADEVFRVYAAANPQLEIRIVNLAPALEPMLRHVIDNDKIRKVDDSLTILTGNP
jgi:biotin operon repressor/anti-sigma regulatory factor (Ser/Thr protein kinase)